MQVKAKLEMLTSAGMKMESYRSARAYDLWQLAELAHDDACRAAIMASADIIPTLVMLLQEGDIPDVQAAAAVLVRRLTANSPDNGRELTNSGEVCSMAPTCTSTHWEIRLLPCWYAMLVHAGLHSMGAT